ncbi:NAD(P) transhydrogenase subunit alpha [Salinarchaeum sp. IM2453]|uniref:NAD(P) transhydrogenase subunit alpha n=1 Tax=Salinarchaeum sp. IM2453 TaxID=2862870 RepID=UPI001C830178|nr:NAD(P) transhydrogenase subunit alpha [Salinarchaeum sp. IM2453]QZA88029.1 NAD(P) transhydrogenase subunit alpha [Salinarchaeum sp. IM2453]
MRIGVPSETGADETRVALTPSGAEELLEQGFDICVATGAGNDAGHTDEAYRTAGCEIANDRSAVFEQSDIILHVRGLAANDPDAPADPYRDGQVIIGQVGPHQLDEKLDELAERGISSFALELTPRISRAQSMDVQSSMDSLSGYRAMTIAAKELPKMIPMEMTAAGTIRPADVFVLGAGVAGLKAISTSERLGGRTRAHDIRPEVKEEVESLGAEFFAIEEEPEDVADEEGHAKEQEDDFYERQRQMLLDVVGKSDIMITTAAVPGGQAPEIISREMIERMDAGSIVVDIAAAGGGNCAPTRADETVEIDGVKVFGPTNLPATIPHTASQLFSSNLVSFLKLLAEDGDLVIDTDDEIIDATLLTHDGINREPHRDKEE